MPAVRGEQAAGTGNVLHPVRDTISHPHMIRIVLWMMLLSLSVVALRSFGLPTDPWPNPQAHAFLELCGVFILGCIVYCLWVEYSVCVQRRILLATIAFSGLALAQFAHGVSPLLEGNTRGILGSGFLAFYYAWQIAASCLLLLSAKTTTTDDKQKHRKLGIQMIAGSLAASLLFLGLLLKLGDLWVLLQQSWHIPVAINRFLDTDITIAAMRVVAVAVSTAALLATTVTYLRHEDMLSNGVIRCLLLLMAGHVTASMSGRTCDLLWWMSHIYTIGAFLVLLVKLGSVFSASYADAHARIEHLEAVHYISSRLSNTLDLRVVLLTFVSDTAAMLSANFATIMLSDDAGETLATVATFGIDDIPLRPSEPLPVTGAGRPGFYSGHTARAFREKQVCVVDDIYTDVEFVPWRVLSKFDGYTVSVPLVYHEVALGVLNLFFESHVTLNDEKVRLFQTLATSAAVAIANAQLYDQSLRIDSSQILCSHDHLQGRIAS